MTSNLVQLSHRVLADVVRSASDRQDRLAPGLIATGNNRSIRKLLTVREVASALHCHPETIYRQIKTDDLPAKRHGNRWKFDPIEVAEWLEQHSPKRNKPPAKDEEHGNTG
jgi:excisionase family DNA binding protein